MMFRQQFMTYLPKWTLASTGPYAVQYEFHEPWYYKNGFPKRKDVSNLVKACDDALAQRYWGGEDSLIWEERYEKVHDVEKIGIVVAIAGVSHVE